MHSTSSKTAVLSKTKTLVVCSVGISSLALLAGILFARSSAQTADGLADRLADRLNELESGLNVPSLSKNA